jgi:hypothetical protein
VLSNDIEGNKVGHIPLGANTPLPNGYLANGIYYKISKIPIISAVGLMVKSKLPMMISMELQYTGRLLWLRVRFPDGAIILLFFTPSPWESIPAGCRARKLINRAQLVHILIKHKRHQI